MCILLSYCTRKIGLDTGRGFCDTPASFPGTPFLSALSHVPNLLQFGLEVPACLPWRTSGGAILHGVVGLFELEPPRRWLAGRFVVV